MQSQVVNLYPDTVGQVVELLKYYHRLTGQAITPYLSSLIADAISDGFAVDTLRGIIRETARAPRPSVRYLDAIIAACRKEGCLTAEQWYQRSISHCSRSDRRRPGIADYEQRAYSDADYAAMAFDLINNSL